MGKLFSLDSKLMQGLNTVADYVVFNILFLICCIPVVTIGAAKSALYRVMFDMMDDKGNLVKRFFKAFIQNFKAITPIHLLHSGILVLLLVELFVTTGNVFPLSTAVTVILAVTTVAVSMLFGNIPAQVAVFESTRKQYLKNSIYIALMEFFRCLAVGLMDLLPLVAILWDPGLALAFGPIWIFFYFSVTCNLSARMFRKPFAQYIRRAQEGE